jgi:hypothetical protein
MKPILVLLAALPLAAAEAPFAAVVPPGAKIAVGIQVRRLAGAALLGEALQGATDLLAGTPLAGLDPAKDIEEVLIAASGTGDKAPAIAVLRGTFHLNTPADSVRYRDIPLIEDPKHPEAVVALLDDSTILAGDRLQVLAAIERVQAGADAGISAEWRSRIEDLRGRYSIWGFGEGLEPSAQTGSEPAKPGDLSSIDRFQFGASLDAGLTLTAEAHLRTKSDAEQMGGMLQFLHAMVLQQGPKNPGSGSNFDMSIDQGTIRIALTVPEAELKKAMKEQRTTLAKAFTSGTSPGLPLLTPAAFAAPSVRAAPAKPPLPPPSEGKIYTNEQGDTVSVTLPVIKREP